MGEIKGGSDVFLFSSFETTCFAADLRGGISMSSILLLLESLLVAEMYTASYMESWELGYSSDESGLRTNEFLRRIRLVMERFGELDLGCRGSLSMGDARSPGRISVVAAISIIQRCASQRMLASTAEMNTQDIVVEEKLTCRENLAEGDMLC